MLDSIYIIIPVYQLESIPGNNDWEAILSNIEYGRNDDDDWIRGKLANLTIKHTSTQISIYGSLAKYYHSDNFQLLNREQIQLALEKLSDELSLPVTNGIIRQIHVTQNLLMDYKVKCYLPLLGYCKSYNRLDQEQSLYYQNSKRTLLFYSKTDEQRRKRQNIPDEYANQNILRYELRFRKRLVDTFRITELKASYLYSEDLYLQLVTQWESGYFNIRKDRIFNSDMERFKDWKTLKNSLILSSIEQEYQGEAHLLEMIDLAQQTGIIKNRTVKARMKTGIKTICTDTKLTVGNPLADELDRKIKEAAWHAL